MRQSSFPIRLLAALLMGLDLLALSAQIHTAAAAMLDSFWRPLGAFDSTSTR
jgi:hypothetical protein